MKKYILVFLIFWLSSCFYSSDSQLCHFTDVFEKGTFSWKHLFSSIWRDPTRICSFSLSEDKENLKYFSKIDEKYFKSIDIKFALDNLDSFIKDKTNEYKTEEKKLLQNIKNEIKSWEKEDEILYNLFLFSQFSSDFWVCYYKKSENKGYCIIELK